MLKTILLLSLFLYVQSSSIVDVVFTVKNLSTNDRLKLNFVTMITSLFQHTSTENLHLHVIGDFDSHHFVEQTLHTLQYTRQIDKLNIDSLTTKYQQVIQPLIRHFSSSHTYYKDPLFFLSPFLHRILPENISRVIMFDIDLRFDDDIQHLYKLFDQFNQSQIVGIARENQPVYRHLLWSYRQENPHTLLGNPPPNGTTGFNSGVLLLDLSKIRQSTLFNSYLENASLIQHLIHKYHFNHPHLGDQDFYTLLSFEHRDLFYILPCHWNRQLCTWWKGKGYDDVWDSYFNCNNDQKISIYHGNCNTPLPEKLTLEKHEL
ncbi:unnamed protein product [Adineta ricciae]|uniref:Xyloside xylosyltransferase 1-like protein n=1 Tax=Adineta ricciae TaxID=249248 RepID=A0A815GAA6_ADIRI|nr:unnamed protein product [Adineta ricciae]CAF1336654.1 unnamed protein product [Adineta ricciae]